MQSTKNFQGDIQNHSEDNTQLVLQAANFRKKQFVLFTCSGVSNFLIDLVQLLKEC
jgi:hypothetical protein